MDPKDTEHVKMDDVVKVPVMDVIKDPVMDVAKDPVMGVVKDPAMDVVNQITVAKPDINIQKPDEIQNSKSSTN